MNIEFPLILGAIAFLSLIALLISDKNQNLTNAGINNISRLGFSHKSSMRIFSTLKGFLLIVLLAAILGAFLYYSQ